MRGRGGVWAGRGVVTTAVLGALVTLLWVDRGVSGTHLAASWQVIDLRVLADDPLGSLWYLHIQPPVHNLVVGTVMAWSPFPEMGTLFVLYGLSLLVTGLLLHDLLVRWGLQPVVGGVIVGFALVNPSLLATVYHASYEVPLACLLVTLVWLVQRHLEQPGSRWLVAISVTLTVAALTRSLLHPLWVLVVLGLLWLVRPVDRRRVAVTLAIPVVLIGGWMVKNEVVFGTPTLSSWLGFNMQRGVTASMDRDEVRAAVADGTVSPIVLEYPWLKLDAYPDWTGSCELAHDHPAASAELKAPFERSSGSLNFNNECFLPAYQQARRDATTLIRHEPGRYLAGRLAPLLMSYDTAPVRGGDDATWMDRIYDPLLAVRTVDVDLSDWNLPLLAPELETLPIEVSLTMVALSLAVVARAAVAVVRLVRRGWRARRDWPAEEVVWLLVTATALVVVVGGDLVEFGENGRFRTMLDPLLIALPLAWLAQALQHRWSRADGGHDENVPEDDEGVAPERHALPDPDGEPELAGSRARPLGGDRQES